MRNDLPAIPIPHETGHVPVEMRSLYDAVRSMKLTFDALLGRVTNSNKLDTLVTFRDLVVLGLITEDDVATKLGDRHGR